MPRTKNAVWPRMAYAFWLRFWKLAQGLVEHLEGHHTSRACFQSWVADELILEVQRHIETQAQEFVDKKVLEQNYIYDFFFDHAKLLPTCEVALLLPDEIYCLEGPWRTGTPISSPGRDYRSSPNSLGATIASPLH